MVNLFLVLPGVALAYAVANQGLRPEIPSYCPEEVAQLMMQCWDRNQHNRPGFAEILERLQVR